jgi:hypothetical protein
MILAFKHGFGHLEASHSFFGSRHVIQEIGDPLGKSLQFGTSQTLIFPGRSFLDSHLTLEKSLVV